MPFPVSYTGQFAPARDVASMEALRRALTARGATDVVREGAVTRFRVGWTVSSGPLWSIDRGVVVWPEQDAGRSFTLSFRRAATICALLCYGWIAGVGMRGEPWLERVAFGTVGFLWIFGVWYLRVPGRVRRFLEQSVTKPAA